MGSIHPIIHIHYNKKSNCAHYVEHPILENKDKSVKSHKSKFTIGFLCAQKVLITYRIVKINFTIARDFHRPISWASMDLQSYYYY